MFAPRKILVPTDFTGDSERALREALAIAAPLRSKIFLLHVDENVPTVAGDIVISVLDVDAIERRDEAIARQKMSEEIRKVASETEVDIQIEERHGIPSDEILRYEREKEIDLVVIEPHAKKGVLRSLMGGVTDRLIKESTCPLLVLPPLH